MLERAEREGDGVIGGSMKGLKGFGRYGSLGFELLASIAAGYYVGLWLDRKFNTHWIAFVGFLLGCYAGFRALFRAANQMTRDIEREEKLERGEDPWADETTSADDSGSFSTSDGEKKDDERRKP